MLSEQMKAEGWIEHDGGECPVDGQTIVRIMHRKGTFRLPRKAYWWTAFDSDFAGTDLWQHEGPDETDIIAYRLETGHD